MTPQNSRGIGFHISPAGWASAGKGVVSHCGWYCPWMQLCTYARFCLLYTMENCICAHDMHPCTSVHGCTSVCTFHAWVCLWMCTCDEYVCVSGHMYVYLQQVLRIHRSRSPLILEWCWVIPSLTGCLSFPPSLSIKSPRALFSASIKPVGESAPKCGKNGLLNMPSGFHKLINWHSGYFALCLGSISVSSSLCSWCSIMLTISSDRLNWTWSRQFIF